MFQPFKNLFSKLTRKGPPASTPAPSAPVAPATKLSPPAKEARPAAPPRTAPPVAAAPVQAAAPEIPSGLPEETFALPLRVVLSRLPASLSASVKSMGGGDLQLPLRKVLNQLPQGVVRISFGELRQGAPAGTFLEVASQDSTMIELPLPEIVARINPALISRRQDQKTIEVPPEVGNVFGPRGETIAPTAENSAAAAPARPAAAPAPVSAPKPVLPTAPIASSPSLPRPPAPAAPSISNPALPKPPGAAPTAPSPIAAPKLPTQPGLPKPPTPAPSLPKPPAAAPIAAPKIPTTAPVVPKPVVIAPIQPSAATSISTDNTQFFLEKEAESAVGTISLPLSALSGNWPDPVKAEINQHNLKESTAELPMANVESGLKTGKIVFTWREVAAWLHPKPFTTSVTGDTLIELPLKVIAPAFIAQHKPAKSQRKLAVGENIPDIFSGGAPVAKPVAPAAPVAAAAPAPAPVAAAPVVAAPSLPKMPSAPVPVPVAAPVDAKLPTTLGELFGDPGRKEWAPKDILAKASTLKGMAGGVISTHDGLMVAGELPAPLKADTVAAFLPQIFSRMNQYAKELQTGGDVSTMTIIFDKVPWQFSKLGKLYFAAMGRPGESLPTQQLTLICGELAKQNK
ncbi:MAG: hypothetical protein JWM68_4274 [Verrucomicrobiales bacterium]|nr:hypothetical protein [Verrucomicrobiales bacterium]